MDECNDCRDYIISFAAVTGSQFINSLRTYRSQLKAKRSVELCKRHLRCPCDFHPLDEALSSSCHQDPGKRTSRNVSLIQNNSNIFTVNKEIHIACSLGNGIQKQEGQNQSWNIDQKIIKHKELMNCNWRRLHITMNWVSGNINHIPWLGLS